MAMVRLQVTMFLWFMFLSRVLGVPTDEFGEFTKIADGDILPNEDKLLMNIVPGYTASVESKDTEILTKRFLPPLDGIEKDNKYVRNLNIWIEKGVTNRGLTFSIYNDDMRGAAVALFRLFQSIDGDNHNILDKWAKKYINYEMYMYVARLSALYGSNVSENDLLPPFISNPRYFVNSETISKAFTIIDYIKEYGQIDPEIADEDQYNYLCKQCPRYITINSNYSGWNLPQNGLDDVFNYFREDIGLNSYYLGLHMLHPFWMSNDELDTYFERHAEHYYYAHQQLMARYMLEKEYLHKKTSENNPDEIVYAPYLSYKNGLPFPTRSRIRKDWSNEKALIKSIDIAIKECIDRGLIVMENGTKINMTDDHHVEELSRLIRANLDGIRTAKVIRSVFGYGSNKSPMNDYNPAPSLLHHPETSLRDPVFWNLIQYMLNYFTDYKNTLEPYDLTQHETDDINIIDPEDTNFNITTYFHSYKFPLDHARNINFEDANANRTFISVKQRRLKHEHFEIKLGVETIDNIKTVARVYLGPQCGGSDCWKAYSRFFELDTFTLDLQKGFNPIIVTSNITAKHSYDFMFDTVKVDTNNRFDLYSIFKFPQNLLIPHGLENGLNLTLFVMLTPVDELEPKNITNYIRAASIHDNKPLGFPFHRPATGFKVSASNYRFYNVTVYHKIQPDIEPKGLFSANLY